MLVQALVVLTVAGFSSGWDINCGRMDIMSSIKPMAASSFPHELSCARINDKEIVGKERMDIMQYDYDYD